MCERSCHGRQGNIIRKGTTGCSTLEKLPLLLHWQVIESAPVASVTPFHSKRKQAGVQTLPAEGAAAEVVSPGQRGLVQYRMSGAV